MSLTLQQVFNNTWNWHIRDGKPAGYNPAHGKCTYWGNGGKCRCAIGASLLQKPDDDLRGYTASELIDAVPQYAELFAGIDVNLLDALQRRHDDSAHMHPREPKAFAHTYANRLRAFASERGLSIPSARGI